MLKKYLLVLFVAVFLVGCKDEVSGKFAGTWVYEKNPKNGMTVITNLKDHYSVHQVDSQMGIDMEYDAIEIDGKYLENEKTGRRYYTLIDKDHIRVGANGGVYVRADK
ncbi:Uncharacterised protein [Yersinia aldovae]|uniref:hypothetical protein n=1 Tax=Yersinia aldovae TaxID=29483 RepID=UPI0005E6DC5F|nr:hypothetical protein [Yersinia aldovae]CNK25967.1 Uncharacterised protein [Yersinia aldovae]